MGCRRGDIRPLGTNLPSQDCEPSMTMKARDVIAIECCKQWEGLTWVEIGEQAQSNYLEDGDAIIAALDAAAIGTYDKTTHVAVPKEPTTQMLIAAGSGIKAVFETIGLTAANVAPPDPLLTATVYHHMLAASQESERDEN